MEFSGRLAFQFHSWLQGSYSSHLFLLWNKEDDCFQSWLSSILLCPAFPLGINWEWRFESVGPVILL